MKMKRALSFLSLVFFLVIIPSYGASKFMFQHLEVRNGLSNSQVNTIFKDSKGYMWFGTASGLNRFDGYEFKVFSSSPSDKTTLPDNFIQTIQEDGDGNLWILTGGGYAVYNPRTERFDRDIRQRIWNWGLDAVPTIIYIDKYKNFMFYVEGKGIYYLQPKQKLLYPFLMDGKRGGIPGGVITSMSECREGVVAMYNDGSMVCINGQKRHMMWFNRNLAGTAASAGMTYTSFVDKKDNIWIFNPYNLWIYNVSKNQWINSLEELASQWGIHSAPIPHDMVKCISQDMAGRYWIGTDHSGVIVIDPSQKSILNLQHNEGNERSIRNNSIESLFTDNAGMVWVGTYKNGLSYYGESIFKFNVEHVGDIDCIAEDHSGRIWLGSNGSGLICWNMATGDKKYYNKSTGFTSDVVVCTLVDHSGKIWAGTFWGGLVCVNGSSITTFKNKPGDANSLANNNVWALAEDTEGNIWIGTLGGGLQKLDTKTGSFTTYNQARNGLANDYVASLCFGKGNSLLIGTAAGLSVMDMTTKRIITYKGCRRGNTPFSNLNINQVYEDSRGLIWIATRDGLNIYDMKSDRLVILNKAQGLANSVACGITEDKSKNMWVTTDGGVSNIIVETASQPGEYSFRPYNYDEMDGLQSREFNLRSIMTAHDGSIIMGGLYGVNIFSPESIKYNKVLPKVIFTGLQLFNEEVQVGKEYDHNVILPKALNELDKVVLDYSQNVFTITFASDNYNLPEKMQYMYKLDGFNDDWLICKASMHRVTFTNLAPGTYTLRVKAVNGDGYGSNEESLLTIVIRPPFWLSIWAYIIYAILIGVGIWYYRKMMKKREESRFNMEQVKREAEKNHEVDDMKLRFFTNISHELRTPLTLIISPLASLIKEETDDRKKQSLLMIHRNAIRLLNMVNQLLDFRKTDVHGLQLNLLNGEIVNYVRNICTTFNELSYKKGIILTFSSKVKQLMMSFDDDKIGKIVSNLLSNAFKFTPEGGSVDVSLNILPTTPSNPTETLEIRVADTGIGVADADKEKIFDRFYQAKTTESQLFGGSGVGLNLVREFATLHGGAARVVDNDGGGSVFIVTIPIRHLNNIGKVKDEFIGTPSEEKKPEDSEPEIQKEIVEKEPEENLEGEIVEKESDMEEAVRPEQNEEDAEVETEGIKEVITRDSVPVGDDIPLIPIQGKPKVLIVDDNSDFLDFMKDSLKLDYNVKVAHDGLEAWNLIKEINPDIILSDVMMPGMNGNELCQKVKSDKDTENIPFILLTARLAEEHRIEGLTDGADDYITKPFNMDILTLRMNKLLQWHNSVKEIPDEGMHKIEPTPSDIVITSMDQKLVQNATRFVEENISRNDLSVEEMSRALGMSRVHLYKKLVAITGKTPIEFIRVIRLKRAAQLLRESQQNVSEIAYQVGFNNPKYFRKYFKDEYGVLPSVYQEKEGV